MSDPAAGCTPPLPAGTPWPPAARRLFEGWCVVLVAANLLTVALSFRGDWRFAVVDDVRQNLFVLERARDPLLFEGDLIADHARAFQPPAFYGLLWLACRFLDVVVVARLLGVFMVLVTLGLAVWAAGTSFTWRSLPFWVVLVPATGFEMVLGLAYDGMARSCAAPLGLLTIVAMQRSGHALFLVAVALAAGFSPTVFVFLAVLAPFKLLDPQTRGPVGAWVRSLLRPAFLYAAVFATSAGALAAWRGWTTPMLGPVARYAEVRSDPAFSDAGRFPHERIAPFPSTLRHLSGYAIPLPRPLRPIALALVVAGGTLLLLRRRPGAEAWSPESRTLWSAACVFWAGTIAWLLARALALRLYFPARYLFPMVGPVLFGAVALAVLADAWLRARGGAVLAKPLVRAAYLLAALGLGAVVLRSGSIGVLVPSQFVYIRAYEEERRLHLFLRDGVPKDAVLAGNPWLLDNVPIFGKRSVWTNYETLVPVYSEYYRQMVARTSALIPAYFSWSLDPLQEFARTTRVTHMIVARRDFARGQVPWGAAGWQGDMRPPEPGRPYIAPFTGEIERRVSEKPAKAAWVWENVPREAVRYESASFLVVDLRALTRR